MKRKVIKYCSECERNAEAISNIFDWSCPNCGNSWVSEKPVYVLEVE